MRRKDRERDRAFAYDVIDRCEYGVAAMAGEGGAPYCVPLSLVRLGDTLYFHCALEGTKLDCLRRSPRVCVSFVASNQAALDKFTTYFQSANVIGTAAEVTEEAEKISALRALCEKLTPANMAGDNFDRAIAKSLPRTGVWRIRMEEVTGKEKPRPLFVWKEIVPCPLIVSLPACGSGSPPPGGRPFWPVLSPAI